MKKKVLDILNRRRKLADDFLQSYSRQYIQDPRNQYVKSLYLQFKAAWQELEDSIAEIEKL